MDSLRGTRYAYPKSRVAYMVPFFFLLPGILFFLLVWLLSSRALLEGPPLAALPFATKAILVGLALLGGLVAWDLWATFRRFMGEEIWITDRDIVWIGRGRVLLKASHSEILSLKPRGPRERAWLFEIETARGRIRFTSSLEHADELIERIERFLAGR